MRRYVAGHEGRAGRIVLGALVTLLAVWMVAAGREAGRPLAAAALGLVTVALVALAPRLPLLSLAAALAGLIALEPVAGGAGVEDPFLVCLVVSSYSTGRYAPMRHQPWAAASVLFLVSINVVRPDEQLGLADVVFPVLFTAAPWLLGLVVQLTQRRADDALSYAGAIEASRIEDVRRATAEERIRIARELHDIVAHDISALSLQAQVSRRRAEAGHVVSVEDLRRIETTAQDAMNDVRRVLGVLRTADEVTSLAPAEGLEALAALVEQARVSGQDVVLRTQGEVRDLPPLISHAAFRIVQEAMTNARRHGSGRCVVEVARSTDILNLRVTNPVSRTRAHVPGHGLRGMQERAAMFGGVIRAGSGPDAFWTVEAELPLLADTAARMPR
jgi:signal transduction histidine kinase